MPGADPAQVMTGVDYPGTQLQTLPFAYTSNWDMLPFTESAWDDSGNGESSLDTILDGSQWTNSSIIRDNIFASTSSSGENLFAVDILTYSEFSTINPETATWRIVVNTSTSVTSVITGIYTATGSTVVYQTTSTNTIDFSTATNGGYVLIKSVVGHLGMMGVNPEDMIVDGDQFLSPNVSHGPEELVPGEVVESVGISVYTRVPSGSPLILQNTFIVDSTATSTTFDLTMLAHHPAGLSKLPPNTASVMVSYNNAILDYGTDYTVNFNDKTITISTQTTTGVVAVTVVGVGGAAYASHDYATGSKSSLTVPVGVPLANIGSLYVTLNGNSLTSDQYKVTNKGVTVSGLTGTNTLQVWVFESAYKGFSEVKEQRFTTHSLSRLATGYANDTIIVVSDATDIFVGMQVVATTPNSIGAGGVVTNISHTLGDAFYYITLSVPSIASFSAVLVDFVETSYTLTQYPGVLGPINAQAIVELNKVRLTPPNTAYYSVSAGQLTFDIDPNSNYPSGVFSLAALQVFVNGIQVRNGQDFILDQPNKRIEFRPSSLTVGDVVAITNTIYSQYYFENGQLVLNTQRITVPNNGSLKVITYTNQDSDMIRTEVFTSGTLRRYTMNRAILNDNYVWVTVEGIPLTNGLDYYIDTDNKTVIVDDNYPVKSTDTIVVMSMTDISDNTVIGYRLFKDILNRTTYKRLSDINSTQLVEPLYTTSTTIVVEEASDLPIPNPAKNAPGVILIAGERIEYMAVNGNTLSRIKRATLGTGPKDVYPIGTEVLDQGVRQILPYKETVNVSTTAVPKDLNTVYVIEEMTVTKGNGITFNTTSDYQDWVRVYHGGMPLRKDPTYVHDTSVLYDEVSANILGSVSTPSALPNTTVVGSAYIVTATNQVWVYTNSLNVDAVNGYSYRGLNYLPPEFTITPSTTSTSTILTLNLPTGRLNTGTTITLVQQTAVDWYASTATSLLNDTGAVATFLRDRQASLPDKYHYGQV